MLVASDKLHQARALEEAEEYRSFGVPAEGVRSLDGEEASAMVGADGVPGGTALSLINITQPTRPQANR